MNHAHDAGPLSGWVIALAGGRTLLGQPVQTLTVTQGMRLSPVYELNASIQPVQQHPRQPPSLVTIRQVIPLLTFGSIEEIQIPRDTPMILVDMLSPKERAGLAQAVDACRQLVEAMRTQDETGLVLPVRP